MYFNGEKTPQKSQSLILGETKAVYRAWDINWIIGKHCLSFPAQSQGALAQKTSHYMFPILRTPPKLNHWLIKCSVYPPKT